jgi:hypothetical protein
LDKKVVFFAPSLEVVFLALPLDLREAAVVIGDSGEVVLDCSFLKREPFDLDLLADRVVGLLNSFDHLCFHGFTNTLTVTLQIQ